MHAVLDEALVSHVGFVVDGQPVVLPHLHARGGQALYLHGSTAARALLTARPGGLPLCVTVTLLDGLVLARSAFHHSVNYRSVVAHGTATVDNEGEKRDALTALVDGVAPGRSASTRAPSAKELAATTVLRLLVDEVSVKVGSGPPLDDAEDLELPYRAGVLPLTTLAGVPEPAPELPAATPVPPHVSRRSRQRHAVGTT